MTRCGVLCWASASGAIEPETAAATPDVDLVNAAADAADAADAEGAEVNPCDEARESDVASPSSSAFHLS